MLSENKTWFVAVVCSNTKATGLVFLHISHVSLWGKIKNDCRKINWSTLENHTRRWQQLSNRKRQGQWTLSTIGHNQSADRAVRNDDQFFRHHLECRHTPRFCISIATGMTERQTNWWTDIQNNHKTVVCNSGFSTSRGRPLTDGWMPVMASLLK